MRTIFWFGLWMLSFGTLEIHVRYSDGLEITLHSWLNKLRDKS